MEVNRTLSEIEKETEQTKETEETEITPKADEQLKDLILSFEYNVKNSEEEQAFTAFQKKYVYKGNYIKTALFGIVALLFLVSFIRSPKE